MFIELENAVKKYGDGDALVCQLLCGTCDAQAQGVSHRYGSKPEGQPGLGMETETEEYEC